MSNKKKLIEVAMPLDAINAASLKEKNIRHGHPSTLHLWWARRPLASARAVIWASLVDDPGSHPELFPTEEEQNEERKRLFGILENLVKWDVSNDEMTKTENLRALEDAKKEILKSTNGNPPEFLDPFAGGGALPLEALRLGMKSHAHDLNPIAVMMNKAMIEIPETFRGSNPVSINDDLEWPGYTGLAKDVEYYGNLLKMNVFEKVRNLYPKRSYDGYDKNVIAWLWARTIKCPNPLCSVEIPLIRSSWISKTKGKEAFVEIKFQDHKPNFEIFRDGNPSIDGTVNRKGVICPHCNSHIDLSFVRNYGKEHGLGSVLITEILEGDKGREYLANEEIDEDLKIRRNDEILNIRLPNDKQHFAPQNYGMNTFNSLFTDRQLITLETFVSEINTIKEVIYNDAINSGFSADDRGLDEGGKGAKAFSEAIVVYLAFALDKLTDYNSSVCTWNNNRDGIRNVFGRQAIPMVWDYAEANPFSNSSGSYGNMVDWIVKVIKNLPNGEIGAAIQFPAQEDCGLRNVMISTDPPYYDNIGYADLSDYFYVWMRQTIRSVYPELFRTVLVPKTDELIASHYRHRNILDAKSFFEEGMKETCSQIYKYANDDIPVTIYYAYKQSDTDQNGTASSGWETMLSAILKSGFRITGTWPLRTEKQGRIIGNGTNALASSIVLVCRKRDAEAPVCTRRSFVNELRKDLKPSLKKLQESNLAPVDMAQSAIGPGIAVFSKYSSVLEADGTPMSIRTALQLINKEIDNFFNEQDSDLDEITRFCVDLYKSYGFNEMKYGDADILGKAKNISVEKVKEAGSITADKGYVSLTPRNEIKLTPQHENIWNLCQVLVESMDTGGEDAAAEIVAKYSQSRIATARDLVYRLFSTADKKGWNSEAYKYNSLINAWPSIEEQSRNKRGVEGQMTLQFNY